jgi:hypothetical protein
VEAIVALFGVPSRNSYGDWETPTKVTESGFETDSFRMQDYSVTLHQTAHIMLIYHH